MTELRAEPFDVLEERIGDTMIVRVHGEMDLLTNDLARDLFLRACRAEPRPAALVLDLIDVPFMNAGGLSVLTDAHHVGSRRGIAMHLVCSQPVHRVVRLCDLEGLFETNTVQPPGTTAPVPDAVRRNSPDSW